MSQMCVPATNVLSGKPCFPSSLRRGALTCAHCWQHTPVSSSCCAAAACSILSGAPRDELLWPWVRNKAFPGCPMLLVASVRQCFLSRLSEQGHELGCCLLVPDVAASLSVYSGCFLGRTGVALGVLKAASSIRGSRADSGLGESGLGCSSSSLCSAIPVIKAKSQRAASWIRCPLLNSGPGAPDLSKLPEPCTMHSSRE